MPYLVDGHNLIPKTPGLTLGAIDVENHLIEILRAFCQNRKTQVEVYFDRAPIGQAGTKKFGAVKAIFVRTGKSADHAIRDRLHAFLACAF